jgi:hypothetical protein
MNIQISKLVTLLKSLENSPMFRATSRDSDNIARFNKTKEIISSVCSLLEFDTYRPHLTYNMQQKNLNAKDSTA